MSTPPLLISTPLRSTPTGEFAAAHGCASELERRVESTKDGFDGRGAGGVLRLSDSVTLILGDCLAHLPMDCDAVVTDPPYGLGDRMQGGTWGAAQKYANLREWDVAPTEETLLMLAGLSPICAMWGGNYFPLPPSRCWLVWDKQNAVPTMSDVEMAWTNLDRPSKRKSLPVGVHEHGHPTEKPVVLMGWTLDALRVPVGATVLDPYMGSGTTGIACIRTGRKFIGIERDPKHFETAVQRVRRELEESVFEFAKRQDGGGQQQALELEPRQTDNDQAERLT